MVGASAVDVSSTDADLTYVEVNDFQSGEKLWSDRSYTVGDVVGEELCQGGTYMRPSLHKVSLLLIKLILFLFCCFRSLMIQLRQSMLVPRSA